MAAKFCANCGGVLGPADRFCPLCGNKVIAACPTCGQAWDGVAVGEPISAKTEAPPERQSPVPNQMREATEIEVAVIASSLSGSSPVYGSDYDKSKDCANCGKAGKKKACNSCGSGLDK